MSVSPVVAVSAFILLAILVLALRRPLLARMGLTHAIQRPRQLVMIAIGLMVSTAVITGAGVGGDSFSQSFRNVFMDGLGETDVVVEGMQGQPFRESLAQDILRDATVAPMVERSSVNLKWQASAVDENTDLYEPRVRVWGAHVESFQAMGGLQAQTGSVPATTAAWPQDGIILNPALAKSLDAKIEDRLQLTLQLPGGPDQGPATLHLNGRIIAIVATTGGDPTSEFEPAAFVPIQRLQAVLGLPGYVNVILLKANEGITTPALTAAVQERAQALAEAAPEDGPFGRPTLAFTDARTMGEEMAKENSLGFQSFMIILGTFTIFAGILLIISLMSMLIEERRTDLSTMRAVGAVRGDITQMHLFEGTLYGIAAAFFGVAAGIGFGAFVIWVTKPMFSNEGFGSIALNVQWSTLLRGAAVGLLLTLTVVVFAAHRITRFNIARGLRGEEEARRTQLSWRAWVGYGLLSLAGAAFTIAALADENVVLGVIGPCLLALGLGGLAVRRYPRTIVFPLVGFSLLSYLTISFFVFTDLEGETDFFLVPVRGLLVTVAATMLLVYLDAPARFGAWLLRQFRRLDPIAVPSLSYARGRRGRTAMTVAMVGLIVLILVCVSTVFTMFHFDARQELGGFDVYGETLQRIDDPAAYLATNPEHANALDGASQVLSVPRVRGAAIGATTANGTEIHTWSSGDVVGLTPTFVQASSFEARELQPGLASAKAALEQVLKDPKKMVASNGFWLPETNEPLKAGETIVFRTPSGELRVQVIAILTGADYVTGLFAHQSVLDQLPGGQGSRFYLQSAAGHDPEQLARDVEAGFRSAGMDALSAKEIERQGSQWIGTMLVVVQAFLGMGFVIGIASIGIITARTVVERRREIGVLRAIGAEPRHILSLFTIEVLFIVTLGVLIGVAGGILVAYASYLAEFKESGAVFRVNAVNIIGIVLVAYFTATLAALLPASRASRIPPAQATRYVE